GYAQHSRDCLPLPTRHITAREVLQFRDQAFLTYYTSQRYLGMVAERFGAETVAQIKQMTSYRLERDLLAGKVPMTSVTLPKDDLGSTSVANRERIPLAL